MPRFFTDNISGNSAVISGQDAVHISRVLRMKCGDRLTVCDLAGHDLQCVISVISPEAVELSVTEIAPCLAEPSVKITLFQALPKSDKLDFIIQKAVELGVSEIVPFVSSRCVSRPDEKTAVKKLERWNKISFEAAKQCGRGIIPRVSDIVKFSDAVSMMKKDELSLMFYENATSGLSSILPQSFKSASVMIGSEGGFEQSEADEALSAEIPVASLGPRILRCETAPLAAVSAIMFISGNLG